MHETDRIIIRMVANANVGDPVPEVYGNAMSIYHRLVEIGVLDHPSMYATNMDIFPKAKDACRKWIEENS